ncbi:MAG: amidohydrolase family protein [Acidimicrobiia bacterium]
MSYGIFDADNHMAIEPENLFTDHIDPKLRHKAVRWETDADGLRHLFYGERPSLHMSTAKMQAERDGQARAASIALDEIGILPGASLNRLHPLKGKSEAEQAELREQFKALRYTYDDPDKRLSLMDTQGLEAAILFPGDAAIWVEPEMHDDIEGIYANCQAWNRWCHETWTWRHAERIFIPPLLSLADLDLAVAELDRVLAQNPAVIYVRPGDAHGRSPADPYFDSFWARLNEARVNVAMHLGGTEYHLDGDRWSEDTDITFFNMNAFMWTMYWGDRPAMETVWAYTFHGLFDRFPNIRIVLSEMGTVWVPYTVRKMDHAFMLGKKGTFSKLTKRPSETFRQHFLVAPYPEESVSRVTEVVGIDPVVFGSDFPHGEGLAYPDRYAEAQLSKYSEAEVKAIMHDNLARFLGVG